ncbi:putative endo-polygalacturonase [Helianthus annuus]|nr:putative endo-polygalacturonase [Helianthus annuus]KAJ0670322.1 putative endo-polygalacturonase [Helianthus annuus]KAJ0857135.1 putative endo-polygalacturonase [Helianthus annuus]
MIVFINKVLIVRSRIDESSLSGRIPDFIGNWTNLTRLDLQGTSMEGRIPSTIPRLTKLKELDLSFNTLTGSIPDSVQTLQIDKLYAPKFRFISICQYNLRLNVFCYPMDVVF